MTPKTPKNSAKRTPGKLKAAAKRPSKNARTVPKNASARMPAKAARKPPAAKTTAAKTTAVKKKTGGFLQTMKDGVRSGIESVTHLIETVTPDALLPKSMKSKRS